MGSTAELRHKTKDLEIMKMLTRIRISNVKFYGALVALSALCLSTLIFAQPKVHAAARQKHTVPVPAKSTRLIRPDYGQMPLLFEKNQGQTDRAAKFVARANGYSLYLAETEAVFSLKVPDPASQNPSRELINQGQKAEHNHQSDAVRMKFSGANAHPAIIGEAEAITKTNYYIGKHRFENVPNYRRVNYHDLYPGIDAVIYGNQSSQLEYDFVVAPNADADQIQLKFAGAENVSVNEKGDLVIKTANAELVQQKPFAYQEIDGQRHEIVSRYVVSNEIEVKFENSEYDHSKPLIIDPSLSYLTYLGGTAFDTVFEVAADTDRNAYISGSTTSLNFHGDSRNANDKSGAYVAKLDAQGANFLYVTVLEGNGDDTGRGIAVDASNNAYVTGIASHFFPTTSGAYDTVHGIEANDDVFVVKLNAGGGLVYSTFLGGNDQDEGFDVAVDSTGKAYITGDTESNIAFPSKNKYQGCGFVFPTSLDSIDAFLTVLNSSGSDITYSTCIGGNVTEDKAFSIALDSSNNAYLTGLAKGGNFPTKNAAQPDSGGGIDAWVAKFNPTLSGDASLIYSTYVGGSGTDQGNGIAVDANAQAIITGLTGSFNFPLKNAFDSTNQINEAFVTVVNANGNALVNSSFLGGSDQDEGNNIAVGENGAIWIVGDTLSSNFPTSLPFQATKATGRDGFVAKIKFGAGVVASSFLGGNGNDFPQGVAISGNSIILGGQTSSSDLATTGGVIKPTSNASATNPDGFVARIIDTRLDSVGVFRPASTFLLTQSTTSVVSQTATQTSQLAGQKGVSGDWDGDGTDTIGSFTNGVWKIRNANFPLVVLPPPFGAITVNFGATGDLPVVGDWDGDGIDTVGVFRPSIGQFVVTDSTGSNPSFVSSVTKVNFGIAGDLPIAGDWDGDGKDSVAVYRPSVGQTFFTNADISVKSVNPITLNPGVDLTAFLGIAEDLPVSGDWNGDGVDSLGLWRPSTAQFFLSDDNANLRPTFIFGQTGDQPIVGDWDGKP
jgi:hypothetical protein